MSNFVSNNFSSFLKTSFWEKYQKREAEKKKKKKGSFNFPLSTALFNEKNRQTSSRHNIATRQEEEKKRLSHGLGSCRCRPYNDRSKSLYNWPTLFSFLFFWSVDLIESSSFAVRIKYFLKISSTNVTPLHVHLFLYRQLFSFNV